MIKNPRLYFILLFSFLYGQTQLSVPENVWEISITQSSTSGDWAGNGSHFGVLGQELSIPGYGKRYFDHEYINNGYYANPYDLYDLDTIYVDGFNTIGRVMRYYNSNFAPDNNLDSLPDFSREFFGPAGITIGGTIDEFRTINKQVTSVDIVYGASDRVNWLIKIPYYSIQQNRSWRWNAMEIPGYSEWAAYHSAAKAGLEELLANTSINDPFLDKIQTVYDRLYTWDSDYSVLWAMEGGPDPISGGIYGTGFNPYFSSDTAGVTLAQIMEFYYPQTRTVTGIGDITVGLNYRVFGDPRWKSKQSGLEIYAGLYFTIPLGPTLAKYTVSSATFPQPTQQVKQLPLGEGVAVWRFFTKGAWRTRLNERFFTLQWIVENGFSSKESLYTPLIFPGTGFAHHDSILVSIGEKYMYRKGFQLRTEILADIDVFPNVLNVEGGIQFYYKNRDAYWSQNKEWDSWMTHHTGYDTRQTGLVVEGGVTYYNMNPVKRILPVLFELKLVGYAPIFIRNQYRLYGGRLSFTTYFQAW